MILISQPVNSPASRTFCPPRPIDKESWLSSTITSIAPLSSSTIIDSTSAGANALITNCAGSSDHLMMSTRSPFISFETLCTREPRIPTQAPTGSTLGSFDLTAILARRPGSRAAAKISIMFSLASGTSVRNKDNTKFGAIRSKTNCGPRLFCFTSERIARTRSPGRKPSR